MLNKNLRYKKDNIVSANMGYVGTLIKILKRHKDSGLEAVQLCLRTFTHTIFCNLKYNESLLFYVFFFP